MKYKVTGHQVIDANRIHVEMEASGQHYLRMTVPTSEITKYPLSSFQFAQLTQDQPAPAAQPLAKPNQ